MHRLKNAHRGERAAVILGGPSLIEQRFDFEHLRRRDYVVFVESKSLTPFLLTAGPVPDYFLMLFPEKCKANAFQNFVYRSFLAHVDISPFVKREWDHVVADMKINFDKYFEPWRPQKGPHKRYRFRPNVYLKDSPVDLLPRMAKTKIISNRELLSLHFPDVTFSNPLYLYLFEAPQTARPFNLEDYYTPIEQDGNVVLRYNGFFNSAAIALYPLLHFMGFREVYFLGMDMSMLGSLEYAALYTFQSMRHFRWYFLRTNDVFGPAYRVNKPFYLRPQSEFEDLRALLNYGRVKFVRVYERFRYAAPIEGIPTMSLQQFLRQ